MKKVGFLFYLVAFTLHGFSQEKKDQSLFEKVSLIEQDSQKNKHQKLSALYLLQKEKHYNLNLPDSGVMLLYVKLAKYESFANKNNKAAISYSDKALQMRNSLVRKPATLSINCFYNLAVYNKLESDYTSALSYFDTILLLCKQYGDPDDYRILSFHHKADIMFLVGDYQEAINLSSIGYSITTKAGNLIEASYFLNRVAQSLYFEGYLDEALPYLEKAEENLKITNDHFEQGTAYKTRALIYEKRTDFKNAELYFLKAISERLQTDDDAQKASDYIDLANFYLNSLKDFSKAKLNYEKVISYANKLDDTSVSNAKKAMAMINLGTLQTLSGHYQEAIQFYDHAIHFFRLPVTDYLNQNISVKQSYSIYNKDALFALLIGKIQLLIALYKNTNDKNYLSKALTTAFLTDSVFTQARHEQLNEQSKLYWRNKTHSLFENAIDICYRLKDYKNAFFFFEKSRSVLLADKLNELSASKHLSAKETNIIKNYQLTLLKEQMILSRFKQDDIEYKEAQNIYLTTKNEMDEYVKALEKKHPLYYQYKYSENLPALTAVQKYLDQNRQSLVYYFTGDSTIYVLGVSGKQNSLQKITATAFDNKALFQFTSLCSNEQTLNKNYKTYLSLSHKIYSSLFQPLQIPQGDVSICMDNFFIPFEALSTDDAGKNLLLNKYSINYVYSARSMMNPPGRSAAKGNFAGFAPVKFASSLNVFPLLTSDAALETSANFYSDHALFTEADATKKNFFSEACSYSVVNIFSHAWADTTNSEPVLYMHDSLIHLSELQMLTNPATQFVLLSACQTNIGKTANGEGIYSLARGFAAAGIPAISATLWKADEETVYQLSGKFNENLVAGMNKSEALQQAKIWYLQNCDRRHAMPFYWANLVLIGSSNPIVFTETNHNWMWIVVAAALILFGCILVMVIFKRKRTKKMSFDKIQQSTFDLS